MKTFKTVIFLGIIILSACTKPPVDPPNDDKNCNRKGKIETAMCGWGVYGAYWIRLDDGTFLQPCMSDATNIDASKLYNGREVEVGYRDIYYTEKANCYSHTTCLAYPGDHINVRITCLKLLGEDKPKEEEPKCKYENQGLLFNNGTCWMIKMNDASLLELIDFDVNAHGLEDDTPVLFDYSAMRIKGNCMPSIPAKIHCIKVANTTF